MTLKRVIRIRGGFCIADQKGDWFIPSGHRGARLVKILSQTTNCITKLDGSDLVYSLRAQGFVSVNIVFEIPPNEKVTWVEIR